MKKLINIIVFLVLLGNTVTVYAQEEFFGNSSGFSFSYSNALNTHENSGGVSLYVKNKMIIGINFTSIDNKVYPIFTLLACPHWGDNPKQLKVGYGLTYAYVNDNHIIGLNLLMVQPFFAESKFPFSLQGSIVVLTAINRYTNNDFEIFPQIGIGYTQTFFANNRVYPLIGLSYSTDLNTKTDVVSAHLGINIKLD